MKIVQINATCGVGSTGKICVAVSELLSEKQVENAILYTIGKSSFDKSEKYASLPYTKWQALKSRVFGNYGFNSRFATRRLLRALDRIQPDAVHLHNLHTHNLHLEMLFDHLREKKIKVYWTFHDCWAFTGYCPYFDEAGCSRWENGCHDCPQKKAFSWFFDRSGRNFERKKRMLQGVDLTVITPSFWLADVARRSFFRDHPIRVIHNGIDREIFSPRESDFRREYGIEDKFVLLGVASGWDARKGLDTFIHLAKTLDDSFKIVLVGVKKRLARKLPDNMIAIDRTESQIKLAEIYSAADLFVNPTREDNYPTVNMEAIACGTPVLTYQTGGSAEIPDAFSGASVPRGDEEALKSAILAYREKMPFTKEGCLARAEQFDKDACFAEIVSLYGEAEKTPSSVKRGSVVQINATCGLGSTGKICVAVSELLSERGIENYILYTMGKSDHPAGIKYSGKYDTKWQALFSRVFGNYGFNSQLATRHLLKELDRIAPTVVHLHNLHAHNLHMEMLFHYLKEKKIKVYWTFHDCWAFTAYCPHYTMAKCDQWQGGCHDCPQRSTYSWFFDRSKSMYRRKKALIEGLDLTIVTPSFWLADETKSSFFKDCPIKVIHNGIDLATFHPHESDFRKKHGLEDRFILLGVAFDWGVAKGLDVFCELAKRLDDRFRIVLVGTDEKVDNLLPDTVLSIHRTENQQELAEIYSAADLFVNPTREEVLGLVNLESLACGTPVVTFCSGGSPECVDESCGIVVPCDDIDRMERAILYVEKERPFSSESCINRARCFEVNAKFKEYVELYGL